MSGFFNSLRNLASGATNAPAGSPSKCNDDDEEGEFFFTQDTTFTFDSSIKYVYVVDVVSFLFLYINVMY